MTCPHRVLLLSALIAGCTETVRLSRDPLDNLVALDLTPHEPTIRITDLALPHHTLQFSAMGRFTDGSTRDITPLVQWSVDNGRLGAFDDRGLFTASHAAAGYATVMVEARGLQATTPLTVMIDATIIDPAFPPPAGNLFAVPIPLVSGDPLRAPKLTYPADDTVFPQSIASTLFQYQRGAMNDAYRIVFTSDVLHLAVETGADRWQADGITQRLLAATGLAGAIRTEIQAASSTQMPATIYVGNRLTLGFSPDAPGGPMYFWSAATNGIMRGGLDATSAGKLYPASTTCVGCHAIDRDGTQLAMGAGDASTPALHAIDVGTLMTKITAIPSRPMGWVTYSPDGAQLVVANNGALTRYNAATGAPIGSVPLPVMRYATHPDWSPDGTYLIATLTTQLPTNLDIKSGSIVRIPFNNGAWGTPEYVVTGSSTNNNYFPKWSPDGKWIAYVHATTTSQGAISAELMLVPSDGGSPRRLRYASHRVGTLDDVPDLASSMPSWAPREKDQGERDWLAFTSVRPYGAVLPTAGRGQIWVTSLDLTSTGDPSTPAFWLPCQDTTVLNNNPVWAKTDFTQ